MRSLAAVQRRLLDRDVRWPAIDRRAARRDPGLLDLLREACLVESYLPVYTAKMMSLFWDDLDATAVFTIEAIEAYGHYHILRRYLRAVGYRPISDAEVIALRRKERRATYRDAVRELVNFMGTEHFAAQFFADAAARTQDAAIRPVLERFAEEERTHARFAQDLLAARVRADGRARDAIVRHALRFRHVGAYVLPYIHPVGTDNVATLRAFDRRFVELVGRPLSELSLRGRA